ncbi:MAG: DNA repair protein RecN [Nitrospirae bacterium]|nr:DNA repair protein RecN [Nitrospirota bacterium]
MLQGLHIKDFAIIHDLHLDFGKGLNVITGETGAGKSIIVDALQTLLGGKGFQENIREGATEALIEGNFVLPPDFPLKEKYRNLHYLSEDEDEIVVRRLISSSGKNKSFLNGNLVNLSLLSELSEALLEIHGQNHQTSLFKKHTQLLLLDSFAGLIPLKRDYETLYQKWNNLLQKIQDLEKIEEEKKSKRSFLLFQIEELESANLSPDEELNLIREKEILSQSEFLKTKSAEAYHLLFEKEESAVLTNLQQIDRLINDLFSVDPQTEPMVQLFKTGQIHLKEACNLLRDYREKIEDQPETLERIERRLFDISQLKKKYGGTISESLNLLKNLKQEVEEIENLETHKHQLNLNLTETETNLNDLADRLSSKRKGASHELEKKLLKELKGLKFEQAQFKIILTPLTESAKFSRHGKETVSFLISLNPGYTPVEIEKVASGGELSRVMLALKTILSKEEAVPVLIFDEIDTGVGGAVAELIGKRLWELSTSQQIFCITHLAQIAAFGNTHFAVEKKIKSGKTSVFVNQLTEKDRIIEIGRMLGGIKITPNTIKHAEEMLARVPENI